MHDEVGIKYDEPTEDNGASNRDHKLHGFTPEEHLGGREEGREGGRVGGREGGRKGGRVGGREGGRKGGREERDKWRVFIINQSCSGSGVS